MVLVIEPSHITMSAAKSLAILPLPSRPNTAAALPLISAENRCMFILPASTPYVYISSPRHLTPAPPFGICEKSFAASFCAMVKEQWSVPMVSISPDAHAASSALLSSGVLNGGLITYFAPSGSLYLSSSSSRYCGQVSRYTSCPRLRALIASSSPSLVERCTTYAGASASLAMRM